METRRSRRLCALLLVLASCKRAAPTGSDRRAPRTDLDEPPITLAPTVKSEARPAATCGERRIVRYVASRHEVTPLSCVIPADSHLRTQSGETFYWNSTQGVIRFSDTECVAEKALAPPFGPGVPYHLEPGDGALVVDYPHRPTPDGKTILWHTRQQGRWTRVPLPEGERSWSMIRSMLVHSGAFADHDEYLVRGHHGTMVCLPQPCEGGHNDYAFSGFVVRPEALYWYAASFGFPGVTRLDRKTRQIVSYPLPRLRSSGRPPADDSDRTEIAYARGRLHLADSAGLIYSVDERGEHPELVARRPTRDVNGLWATEHSYLWFEQGALVAFEPEKRSTRVVLDAPCMTEMVQADDDRFYLLASP